MHRNLQVWDIKPTTNSKRRVTSWKRLRMRFSALLRQTGIWHFKRQINRLLFSFFFWIMLTSFVAAHKLSICKLTGEHPSDTALVHKVQGNAGPQLLIPSRLIWDGRTEAKLNICLLYLGARVFYWSAALPSRRHNSPVKDATPTVYFPWWNCPEVDEFVNKQLAEQSFLQPA